MKRRKKYLLLFTIIYLILLFFKKTMHPVFFLSDHGADLICVPWSLLLIGLIMNRIPGSKFKINTPAVFVAVIYFSFVFEVLMPHFSNSYTADPKDVICYMTGGMFYLIFFSENKLPSKAF